MNFLESQISKCIENATSVAFISDQINHLIHNVSDESLQFVTNTLQTKIKNLGGSKGIGELFLNDCFGLHHQIFISVNLTYIYSLFHGYSYSLFF